LEKRVETIRRLNAGNAIFFSDDEKLMVVTPENKPSVNHYDREACETFQQLSASTGGIMGLSQDPKSLPLLFEMFSEHILQHSQDKPLDIAFVLDTTASMQDDITQVKENLVKFLKQLKPKTRIALMEYRDKGSSFLNKIDTDFTSNFDTIETALKNIKVDEGGDKPEAAFDALLSAKNTLSWGQDSKRVVLLITDAPPHPTTLDNKFDQSDVVSTYNAANVDIAIYPIITAS